MGGEGEEFGKHTEECDFGQQAMRDINSLLLLGVMRRRCASSSSLPKGVVGTIIEGENLSRLDWPERFDDYAVVAPVRDKRPGVWPFTVRAVVVDESG